MARTLDFGIVVYDAKNYNNVMVISSNEDVTIVRDDNYNHYEVETIYLYVINTDLTNKYGITICDEHNETNGDYPYYIPLADENAYDFELEHFSIMYS